jgi:hypothetical protein
MTREEIQKVAEAIKRVQDAGHGSVEVVIQDGKILDIVKKERERIN